MSLRNNLRFPWLDLWILPTLVLIGWAIFRLAKAEPEIAKADRHTRQMQDIFTQSHEWIGEGPSNVEAKRRESDRAWQEAAGLSEEYMSVAQRLESTIPELESMLDKSPLRKNFPGAQRSVADFNNWVGKEKERISVERLDARSKELEQQLDAGAGAAANSGLRLNHDLGSLINDVDHTYQQYLLDFKSITENAGKPFVHASTAARTASARQAIERLTELGQEARKDVQALKAFSEAEPPLSLNEASGNWQEMQQAFMQARSPAEFLQRMSAGAGSSAIDHESFTVSTIRLVRYGLLATLAALTAFILVDVYRRAIVSPLRLKLVEREGLIEHQKKLAHFEELAAGLAHEIRNPLTAISARLYTIQRKLREGTPEYQDAEIISSEIERANQILKEFIQVTRPAPPRLELITAGLLLEDVSQLMGPQLERKAVKLEVQLPARTRFYGDQQQLKQVLVNLVQNAAESMAGGGEVILRAREGRVPFKGALTRASIIEVQDNGPGIRPEVQERLFEPFFSTKKEGTGLGLPISARIIDRHGGRLDFETELDHGTTFRIVLPSYE